MKLLSKRQVDTQKQSEQAVAVAEGAKLARRIDRLREMGNVEEANLKKFRDASLEELKKEIREQSEKVSALKNEVRDLEEQRKQLLVPLTRREEAITKDEGWLAERRNHLQVEVSRIEILKIEAENAHAQAEKRIEIATEKEERVAGILQEAETKLTDAGVVLRNAKKQAEKILSDADFREKTLVSRETFFLERERNVEIRMENVQRREREQDDRERAINDKYQTLLRTEKRYVQPNS